MLLKSFLLRIACLETSLSNMKEIFLDCWKLSIKVRHVTFSNTKCYRFERFKLRSIENLHFVLTGIRSGHPSIIIWVCSTFNIRSSFSTSTEGSQNDHNCQRKNSKTDKNSRKMSNFVEQKGMTTSERKFSNGRSEIQTLLVTVE